MRCSRRRLPCNDVHFLAVAGAGAAGCRRARAHHGWSSFDQDRPIYLEGKARERRWRNPHAEFELRAGARPEAAGRPGAARRCRRSRRRSTAPGLLAAAQLPTRKDKVWDIELAPLTRMEAWKVAEIKPGASWRCSAITFAGEKGEPVMRVEYLFVGGKAYGLRSSPA